MIIGMKEKGSEYKLIQKTRRGGYAVFVRSSVINVTY